jgi:PTH1 family peptidyl-tRNA hydrolase
LAPGTIKLVVGLGNPGRNYSATRHNIGYRVIDALEDEHWDGLEMLKPESFMNTSGGPVAEMARRNGWAPQDILVVCDDFALPLGSLRLRLKGSSGGHNGLDSILNTFATQDVPRLRVGIGPVPPGEDPADFVLTAFKKNEKELVQEMVLRAAEAVKVIAAEGFEAAMNTYNKKAEA